MESSKYTIKTNLENVQIMNAEYVNELQAGTKMTNRMCQRNSQDDTLINEIFISQNFKL